MLNLTMGYLILIILLFGVNMGLFLSSFKLKTVKYVLISLAISLVFLITIFVSSYLTNYLSFLDNYFYILFIITSVILIIIVYSYLKNNKKLKSALAILISLFIILTISLSSQSEGMNLFNSLLFTLFLFIILFSIYQVSKLLMYAKRPFHIVTSEYMVLEAIFIFFWGLTYFSTKNLNYKMFRSFLILTPTYKLVYMAIGIILLIVIGLYFNDRYMKKKFN